jgi:hypothetical protein
MFKKFIFVFAVLALVAVFAGTVPGTPTYKITLLQTSVVKDTELKAGDYRVSLGTEKVSIDNGKKIVEVSCKIESVEKKFDTTAIRYTQQNGKQIVSEIRVGGTKTRLVFNP